MRCVEHAYTRCVALPTMSFILPSCQPLLLPAHGHAVLPTGLSSSLNGLSATLKPLFGIGRTDQLTHILTPRERRCPSSLSCASPDAPFPSSSCSPSSTCESQSSPSEVTSLKIRFTSGRVLLTSFSSSARCCAPAGLKALNALPADCRLPIVCAHRGCGCCRRR